MKLKKRKIVYERYQERLDNIKGIQIRQDQPGVQNNYAYFPIVLENYKYSRDELLDKLKKGKYTS